MHNRLLECPEVSFTLPVVTPNDRQKQIVIEMVLTGFCEVQAAVLSNNLYWPPCCVHCRMFREVFQVERSVANRWNDAIDTMLTCESWEVSFTNARTGQTDLFTLGSMCGVLKGLLAEAVSSYCSGSDGKSPILSNPIPSHPILPNSTSILRHSSSSHPKPPCPITPHHTTPHSTTSRSVSPHLSLEYHSWRCVCGIRKHQE